MKAMARTIAAITIAEPRSPCTRQPRPARAATIATGRRLRRTFDSWSWRRTSRSAQNTTSASFRNSDGCKLNDPKATHARASLTVVPTPGTNGSSIPRPATINSGMANRFSHTRLMRIATIMPTRPIAAHDHLAGEDVVRAVALGGLHTGRRRQHHHQAEHHEHRHDDADHVVRSRRRAPLDVPEADAAAVARLDRTQSGRPARRLVAPVQTFQRRAAGDRRPTPTGGSSRPSSGRPPWCRTSSAPIDRWCCRTVVMIRLRSAGRPAA